MFGTKLWIGAQRAGSDLVKPGRGVGADHPCETIPRSQFSARASRFAKADFAADIGIRRGDPEGTVTTVVGHRGTG